MEEKALIHRHLIIPSTKGTTSLVGTDWGWGGEDCDQRYLCLERAHLPSPATWRLLHREATSLLTHVCV